MTKSTKDITLSSSQLRVDPIDDTADRTGSAGIDRHGLNGLIHDDRVHRPLWRIVGMDTGSACVRRLLRA